MHVEGTIYSNENSIRYSASLVMSCNGALLLVVGEENHEYRFEQLVTSEAIGNLPVRVTFPDGRVFVAKDNRALKHFLGGKQRETWVAKLERNIPAILACVALTLTVIFSVYRFGIPYLSSLIVSQVPNQAKIYFGEQVLAKMDLHFEPSTLSEKEKEAIRRRIMNTMDKLPPMPIEVSIEFRSLEKYANAFALPGGKVVILDGLMSMATTPAQIDSIIYHELGHVYHQHVMHSVVESSLLAVGVAVLTGESTGVLDSLIGGGVFILNSSKSRQAEREADQFAIDAMKVVYGTTEPMATMFQLLDSQDDVDIPEWFSTHPDMKDRVEQIKK